jgi:hypothetical protein
LLILYRVKLFIYNYNNHNNYNKPRSRLARISVEKEYFLIFSTDPAGEFCTGTYGYEIEQLWNL